jgi:peroxiredoxin
MKIQACADPPGAHNDQRRISMAHPLEPNQLAPEFTLLDGTGQEVKLSGYRGRNVVLAFYPGDWTPVCSSQLSLFQETLDDIHQLNAEVLALSCDSPPSHRAWAERTNLSMPLLSDFWPHGQVARAYGVFRDGDGTCERALFFLDATGFIRETWVAEDPDIAPGLNIVFDALERLRGQADEEPAHV